MHARVKPPAGARPPTTDGRKHAPPLPLPHSGGGGATCFAPTPFWWHSATITYAALGFGRRHAARADAAAADAAAAIACALTCPCSAAARYHLPQEQRTSAASRPGAEVGSGPAPQTRSGHSGPVPHWHGTGPHWHGTGPRLHGTGPRWYGTGPPARTGHSGPERRVPVWKRRAVAAREAARQVELRASVPARRSTPEPAVGDGRRWSPADRGVLSWLGVRLVWGPCGPDPWRSQLVRHVSVGDGRCGS